MGNVEFDYDRSDALNESRGELYNLHREVASQYTLSKEDFDRDFKGDDFSQGIGNCWMVSALDSFVNYGDYEKLIRTHVKKNNRGGYDITLPMGKSEEGHFGFLKKKETYHITREDLLPQVSIEGKRIQLLDSDNDNKLKKGIHCLIIALGQKLAGRRDSSFDYNVLNGGNSIDVMDVLMTNFYALAISRDSIGDDSQFNKRLRSYFKKFDKRTDMMVVAVKWQGGWNNMGDVSRGRGITNHGISVDSVFYKDVESPVFGSGKEMWVRLSNPHDSSYTYEMPYSDFKNKCGQIYFGSKKMKKVEKDYGEDWTYTGDNERLSSKFSESPRDSLNGYIQSEWGIPLDENGEDERNLVVKQGYQLPNGDIVSQEERNGLGEKCFIVESYGKRIIVKRNRDRDGYTFSSDGIDVTFKDSLFSDKGVAFGNIFNDLVNGIFGTGIRNKDPEKIKFFTSAMEFANSINYLKKMKYEGLVIKEGQIFIKDKFFIPLPINPELLGFKKNISIADKTNIVNYVNKLI